MMYGTLMPSSRVTKFPQGKKKSFAQVTIGYVFPQKKKRKKLKVL